MKAKLPKRSELLEHFRVTDGKNFRLRDYDAGDTLGLELKGHIDEFHRRRIEKIGELQQQLSAGAEWAVLIIIQAMDAAGKDSLIKHVMSGVNPQSCVVHSFKQPSEEELRHDFLWRTSRALPERGQIGIFNRSYYEEVLVVRVHPELLEHQHLPAQLVTEDIWRQRCRDIRAFERYLSRNGTAIRKLFLNVSKDEQKKRFLDRLNEPEKNWKFSASDVREREHWDDYMAAYEDAIRHTASEHAPWFVIPADHKWFAQLVTTYILLDALSSLNLHYPNIDREKRKSLEAARELLNAESAS
jgi:PPK2 family polyphosphate:nucleotide phosphotransferase